MQSVGAETTALEAENHLLGAAVENLEAQLKQAGGWAVAAARRAATAEIKLHSKPAAGSDGLAAQVEIELQRLRRKSASDRILLSQAERRRQAAGQELAAARQQAAQLSQQNAELQASLLAAQRQLHQLDSLQDFAGASEEQRRREQQLAADLEHAATQVRMLEGRCAGLEAELGHTAAALRAAQQLADACSEGAQPSPQRQGRPPLQQQQQQEQQERAASLSLSDLCDLDGLLSQADGIDTSPQRSCGDAMPSRQQALMQQQRRRQGQQRQQHESGVETAGEEGEVPGLPPSLQHQLTEQQRQLATLQAQLQQQQQQQQPAGQPACDDDQAWQRARQLQAEVDKVKRRNTQLQTALAEASLQAARAAAATHKQLAAAQEEAARLRRQLEEAEARLAGLRGTAAAFAAAGDGGDGEGESGAARLQLVHAELLECAARCNAALEQNAALLQEKQQWLQKLRAAEAEAERCRTEAQALRLQLLHLLPSTGAGPAAAQQQEEQREQLVQQLLDGQAAEAAMREVLAEAREEQVAACKALAAELRRVHALERLRIGDVAEQQRLQRRVQHLQRECQQLAVALVAAQQQQQQQQGAGEAGGSKPQAGADFRIAAFRIAAPEEGVPVQS